MKEYKYKFELIINEQSDDCFEELVTKPLETQYKEVI